MPRKFFKRLLPDDHAVRSHRRLQLFGTLLHDPNLWHLNRRSVSGAAFVGLFCAFVPVPFQMLLSAGIAILARVNLPLSVALVWVTNPLTMPPLFYWCYRVGAWLLGRPARQEQFELSVRWLMTEIELIWQPLLLGSLLMAVLAGTLGALSVRLLWRLHVIREWRRKKMARGRLRTQKSL